MVNRRPTIPPTAWNFVCFGLMVFLCCSGYSVARAKAYQIELAEYKLQVNTAISQVKKVSDTLEQVSNSPTIPYKDKRKIKTATQKSDRIIESVEQAIEQETDKLINPNQETENEGNNQAE